MQTGRGMQSIQIWFQVTECCYIVKEAKQAVNTICTRTI